MTGKIEHCTLFNKSYLLEGLTLIETFLTSVPDGNLWVLCIDKETYHYLRYNQHDRIKLVDLQSDKTLNESFEKFLASRTFAESIFTIKSHFVSHVLNDLADSDWVVYVDADSIFMPNYEARRIPGSDKHIILSPHYRSHLAQSSSASGEYNAGYIGFRKSEVGLMAVNYWRDSCTDWCSVQKDDDRYADQKYLEGLAIKWPEATFFAEFGINCSTWSFESNQRVEGNQDVVELKGKSILTFHFHSLSQSRIFTYMGINRYGDVLNATEIGKLLYRGYIDKLNQHRRRMSSHQEGIKAEGNFIIPAGVGLRTFVVGILKGDVALNRLVHWKNEGK